jgi:hypothetical protein
VDIVVSIPDTADKPMDFGDDFPIKTQVGEKLGWLWSFKGQIKIISTQYLEGGLHYALRPRDFIPLVNELAEMHKNGYVHGDIRAFNMLLNCKSPKEEKEGTTTDDTSRDDDNISSSSKSKRWQENNIHDDNSPQQYDGYFIDFDLSGKLGENTKYPKGYNSYLPDGERPGKEGKEISYRDDWKALYSVIFNKHKLLYPALGVDQNNKKVKFKLSTEFNILSAKEKLCSIEVQKEYDSNDVEEKFNVDTTEKCFLGFLYHADKLECHMEPDDNFQDILRQYNLFLPNNNDNNEVPIPNAKRANDNTNQATGSLRQYRG